MSRSLSCSRLVARSDGAFLSSLLIIRSLLILCILQPRQLDPWSRCLHRRRVLPRSPHRHRYRIPHHRPLDLPGRRAALRALRQGLCHLRRPAGLLRRDGQGRRVFQGDGLFVFFVLSSPFLNSVLPFSLLADEPQDRQTSADFLVACTDPKGRFVRDGHKDRVPKTADEFAAYWRKSELGKASVQAADAEMKLTGDGKADGRVEAFRESAKSERAKRAGKTSNYLISYPMMVRLAMTRRYQMQMNDLPTLLITTVCVTTFPYFPSVPSTDSPFSAAPPCSKLSSSVVSTSRCPRTRAVSSVVVVSSSSPSSFVSFFLFRLLLC